jgi:selenocysteine lyase/cysteine desulfurase
VPGGPATVGNGGQQLLEQRLELAALGRRERREQVVHYGAAVCQHGGSRTAACGSEDECTRAAVAAGPALDQVVGLETVDQPHRRRMRDAKDAGQEVDRLARTQTEVDHRRAGAQAALVVGDGSPKTVDSGEGERAEHVCLARAAARYVHEVHMPHRAHEQTAADYRSAFGSFDGRVWLNAAHQGPLPRVAVAAAEAALREKAAPHLIADDAFVALPRRLRQLLGQLIGAPAEEIILGNSASWGLQVLANGLRWRAGDDVLVLADEFPATVFPWLVAEERGVSVRQLELDHPVLEPERLEHELAARTRVVAVNWVRSLTGHVVDLAALHEVCERRGVHLVVNVTQGLGALLLDILALPVAAISCSGFKWLLGPYATGFAWIRPDVLNEMRPTQAYWLALPDGVALDLNAEGEHRLRDDLGPRLYDVFGTANFLNFAPWAAALEYLLAQGLPAIAGHDQALVEQLIAALEGAGYDFVSPTAAGERAAIVVLSAGDPRQNEEIHRLLAQNKIDVALRAGNLRLSPHLYNTFEEIDRAVGVLIEARALAR